MTWDDAAKRLTIEPGAPAGRRNAAAAAARNFKVQMLPSGATRDVTYNGRRLVVTFQP